MQKKIGSGNFGDRPSEVKYCKPALLPLFKTAQLFQLTFLTWLFLVTVNLTRPLRRRFFRTLRPLEVAMRARKPCTRARRRIFG